MPSPLPASPPGSASRRPLVRVPVPGGPTGADRLLEALPTALDGSGPAIAPVPVVSSAVSNSYVMSVLEAVRADDPSTPLESDDVAVVMPTSGSTGSPRGVLLTTAQLTALSDVVNGPGAPLWILALPVTSIGGLNVLLRAIAAGHTPVVLPSIGGAGPFTPTAFTTAVNVATARSGDVRTSLVPAQVARLLADPEATVALAACTQVLVGGGPLRASLRSMAAELGIALTPTYGATETSGGCVYDGRPLPGVTVRVIGDEPSAPGVLEISGPVVARGYRQDPAATARHFVPADGGGRAFRTADLGRVAPDGTVEVLGRADDVIVINGINVSPGAVERVVQDLPDVVAAAVVPVTGDDREPHLVAFVEVRDQARGIGDTVRQAVGESLGAVARPQHVRSVARLPHLPAGKVDRRLLQEWAQQAAED